MSADAYRPACQACKSCASTRYYSLCRNVERNVPFNAFALETVVSDSCELATFCEACGPEPALQMLREYGLTPLAVTADPPTPLCTNCQGRFIAETAPHVVYVVELDEIDGGSVTPLELLWRAPICSECTSNVPDLRPPWHKGGAGERETPHD